MLNIDHNPVETEEGVWFPYKGNVELLIAHVSNMAFQRKLARLQQPHAKLIEAKRLPVDLQKEIMCKAMAGTVFKGWRGDVKDGKGEPVPFTEAGAFQVLMNQPDAREFVSETAALLENFRQEEAKDLGKS